MCASWTAAELCLAVRLEDGSYLADQTFEQLLAVNAGPEQCGYDCAASPTR